MAARCMLAAGLCLLSLAAAGEGMAALEELRWSKRVLLVFAPTRSDARMQELEAAIARRRCDLDERDVEIMRMIAAEGPAPSSSMSARDQAALRRIFDAGGEHFRVVLLGKDGGEKFRADVVPALERLFELIDGMPMRRAEMRERGTSCVQSRVSPVACGVRDEPLSHRRDPAAETDRACG